MEELLTRLRAVAEPTRLRLLALCAQGDLTVSDLTGLLGQSQPRVSRHLKLLCDAGLLERFPEGAWVFYRLARRGQGGEQGEGLAHAILALLPQDDPVLALDRERLSAIQNSRADRASAYFRDNAAQWDRIRSLYVDESEVEAALCDLLKDALKAKPGADLLDIGTGTGRLLQLLSPRIGEGVGIDSSREMLALARSNLETAGIRNALVRQGSMYQLPWPGPSFDIALIHQVLHFAEQPDRVLREAARVLRPGGHLVLVDFAPHDQEFLRSDHNHYRLGFSDADVAEWFRTAGLNPVHNRVLPGSPLTVVLWLAERTSEEI